MTEDLDEVIGWPYFIVEHGRSPFSITNRSAVAFIAIISIISCFIDILTSEETLCCCRYPISEHLDSLRRLLLSFFQLANLLLLLATIVENSMLVQVYVWYVLAFVLLGLAVTLMQFLIRAQVTGVKWAALGALPEVAFLFVLARCLPLVDKYGRDLKCI